ncbi:hypothetical protein SEA_ROBSFEET_14 [Microbacterium phage RobsFeet]|uniref:Uncharacterized protein n=1 Tax=Microbacterium phage RobsFeet TaxID=2201442 RepID=A0A2Z4Q7L2_9CAUD|nr:hypothetical protein HOT43_gp14 [Microbacterium phage RobsFeet]AWY06021.1 hypothetical protein SEA_ROBSFEET_14 [Microbacterium phage RobsFeet]
MIEVWCEGCQCWYPLSSVHGWQFPLRGSTRFPRRVRSQHPHG